MDKKPTERPESSTQPTETTSKKWYWASIIDQARHSSEIYRTSSSTDPAAFSQKVIDTSEQIEGSVKSHPKLRYPNMLETILRKITPGRDTLPKETRYYKIT